MDFMFEYLADGRAFRIFNLIDDFTRECLVGGVDVSLSGPRICRVLAWLQEVRELPATMVSGYALFLFPMWSPRRPGFFPWLSVLGAEQKCNGPWRPSFGGVLTPTLLTLFVLPRLFVLCDR